MIASWQKRLKRWKHQYELFRAGVVPAIESFDNYSLFVAEYGKIHLGWKVSNAHRITISSLGDVTGRSEIVAKMPPNTHRFVLTAYGGFKKTQKEITVKVAPMRAEKVPAGAVNIPQPIIKSLAMQQKGGIFHQASKVNKGGMLVRWPQPPEPADWERLQNSLKNSLEVKKLEELEAHLARLKNQDLLDKASIFNEEKQPPQA